MVVTEPGNYGWPYCATAELPYVDYDFATGQSGATFNCDDPVNQSPNNTGRTSLPPVTQPDVWYSYTPSAEFPELETGGIGPMAGPAYQFDAKGPRARLHRLAGVLRQRPALLRVDARLHQGVLHGGGDVRGSRTCSPTFDFDNPIDLEFGPDGSFYVLEYGDGFFGKNLPGAELARIDFLGATGNRSPTVTAQADDTEGARR